MKFLLIFGLAWYCLIGSALSVDVEAAELKCPGECPSSLPTCLFYIHPIVNNKFYMCIDDQAKLLTCPEGSIFYPAREQCDFPLSSSSFELKPAVARSVKDFVRRPLGLNKHVIKRLQALEDRVKALEIKVNGNSSVEVLASQDVVPTRPTMNISDEVKQQIAASINNSTENSTVTPSTTSSEENSLKPEVSKQTEIVKSTKQTIVSMPSTTSVTTVIGVTDTNTVNKIQSTKLNNRFQPSNSLFQLPVNDFHSNFGTLQNNKNNNNQIQKDNNLFNNLIDNNIFRIPANN